MTAQTSESVTAAGRAPSGDRAVGVWLLVCCAMVFAMAVIGAITRLTESGLSIMEWAPISGILPPLSQAEWHRIFELYKEIPEYRYENAGMTLAEFKRIFWWEYIHRLWGRLIGLVFLLPFLWFLARRRLSGGLAPKLLGIFVLGALQGLMGWVMVASGFAERDDVSQYRLVAHLALAIVIYGALLQVALELLEPSPRPSADRRTAMLRFASLCFIGLAALTILSGGFVAGLNAGLIYNTFPLMDGEFVPPDYRALSPWPLNFFENVAAVQFNHRLLATGTLVAALGLWLWAGAMSLAPGAARALALTAAMAGLQFALGVATLLLVVPAWLGTLHQAGALVLLGLGIWTFHRLRPAL